MSTKGRAGLTQPKQRGQVLLYISAERSTMFLTQSWRAISFPTKRKRVSNVGFHIAGLLLNSPALNICSHFYSSSVANFCSKDWYLHAHMGSGSSLCSVQQAAGSRVSKERGEGFFTHGFNFALCLNLRLQNSFRMYKYITQATNLPWIIHKNNLQICVRISK